MSLLLLIKIFVALTLTVLLIWLYRGSKKHVGCYVDEIKEYGFKPACLAYVGLFLIEKINIKLNSDYEGSIRNRITDLYGYRRVDCYYRIHLAQKITLMLVLTLLLSLLIIAGRAEPITFLFMGVFIILLYFWVDKELEKKIIRKKREILIDLPDLVNTLALMVNAGLPFTTAVQKAARDFGCNRTLYKEINQVIADINSGKPISQAYEDLAYRCRVPEITRFVSTVLQNINLGSSDLVYVLRNLAQEAWEKRKDIARKQGEEASSKLVFPMVMVFLAVAIIVLAPALMTMSQ
jgi:tight adherence protein C